MIRDPEDLLGREALGDALDRLSAAVRPVRAVSGWATVELDRATAEVSEALEALGPARSEPAPDDDLLGARARLLRFAGNRDLLLLEPATEGLLAASLARLGEGTVARYLLVEGDPAARAREAGLVLSAEAAGPLGLQRRLVGGSRWGPHLIVVERADEAPPATIER